MNQISLQFINEINLNLTNSKRCVKELIFLKRTEKRFTTNCSLCPKKTFYQEVLLSDTEIATIMLTFQQGLSSDESNPTDDTYDMDIVEEGIVLASV